MSEQKKHSTLYWWFWLHLTREGRQLRRDIAQGIDFDYDDAAGGEHG